MYSVNSSLACSILPAELGRMPGFTVATRRAVSNAPMGTSAMGTSWSEYLVRMRLAAVLHAGVTHG